MSARPKEFWMTATLQGKRCLLEKRKEAVEKNEADQLKSLLQYSASFRVPELNALLGVAVLKKSDLWAPVAVILLENGADPDGRTGDGAPFAVHAAGGECDVLLELLIDAGCDINRPRTSDGVTALHRAAWQGAVDTVDRLLRAGAECDAKDNQGRTPLLTACQGDELATVSLLLRCSDANTADDGMNSPLHWAAAHGNARLVKELLCANCDVDAQNEEGNTALMLAAGLGDAVIAELLLNCSDCDIQNEDGDTALLLSAQEERWACFELLIPCSDVNISDDNGKTALFHVSSKPQLVRLLLQYGAEPDVVTADGCALLSDQHLTTGSLSELLAANCNALAPDGSGKTLMQRAVYEAKTDRAKMLYGYMEVNQCNTEWLRDYLGSEEVKAKGSEDQRVAELCLWLRDQMDRRPFSLQHSARTQIRRSVGSLRFTSKVAHLPIPMALVNYVSYNNA